MKSAEQRAQDYDNARHIGSFERNRIAALLSEHEADVRADERAKVLGSARCEDSSAVLALKQSRDRWQFAAETSQRLVEGLVTRHDEALALLGDEGVALGLTEAIKRRSYLLYQANEALAVANAEVERLRAERLRWQRATGCVDPYTIDVALSKISASLGRHPTEGIPDAIDRLRAAALPASVVEEMDGLAPDFDAHDCAEASEECLIAAVRSIVSGNDVAAADELVRGAARAIRALELLTAEQEQSR